jgi:hypothetical protein
MQAYRVEIDGDTLSGAPDEFRERSAALLAGHHSRMNSLSEI